MTLNRTFWGTIDALGHPTLHYREKDRYQERTVSRFFPVPNGLEVVKAYEQDPFLYLHLILFPRRELE